MDATKTSRSGGLGDLRRAAGGQDAGGQQGRTTRHSEGDAVAVDHVVERADEQRAAGDAAAGGLPVAIEVPPRAQAGTTAAVRKALADSRRLHIAYYVPHRDETTERDVEPMRLLLDGQGGYLEGWCRRAEGVRLFRLDRITSVEVLDAPADVPAEARSRDMADELFTPSPDDMLVTLELAPTARWVTEPRPVR